MNNRKRATRGEHIIISKFEDNAIQLRKKLETAVRQTDEILTLLRAGIKEPVYEKSLVLEKNCEDIALYAREIPVCTGSRNAEKDVERNINAAYRCTAGYTGEGWFRLAIPALLPKKNAAGNVNYIRGSLYPQLNVFFSNHPRKRFGKCVIS